MAMKQRKTGRGAPPTKRRTPITIARERFYARARKSAGSWFWMECRLGSLYGEVLNARREGFEARRDSAGERLYIRLNGHAAR